MLAPVDRLVSAAALLLAYGLLCGVVRHRHRRRQQAAESVRQALLPAAADTPTLCVLHASQTGQAEALAVQTAQTLHTAGLAVHLDALGKMSPDALCRAGTVLFVVSTHGEGDPPDDAAPFVHNVMGQETLDLSSLHFGVLALGDSRYQHFCEFGRALEQGLRARGAHQLFERVEVDQGDPAAVSRWQQRLAHIAGTSDLPDWKAPVCEDWQLQRREHLNPGSQGDPVHHLELAPPPGRAAPDWEAGDLVQVEVPAAPGRLRDYTIASIPEDGSLHLLVRQVLSRPDAPPGLASNWLTQGLAVGEVVKLRVSAHRSFRIGQNANRPLILIGNGTGLAGLRSHWRARSRGPQPAPVWLIYGERQPHCDAHHRDEITQLAAAGGLSRVDLAYSREPGHPRYVQDIVHTQGERLKRWIGDGAALYICGSLQGMAGAVDLALREVLGTETLDALTAQGRYRRDVY